MAKNFLKTFFSQNKINYAKTPKLNLSNKFSDIKTTNDYEFSTLQQHSIDVSNILSSYYTKKEENNNRISSFLEKINSLNSHFYINKEKFILTRSSLDKINDDLFLNLFKQINCYIEEIKRLNKKIFTIENNDYKQIIKKLNKDILEKKEKIKTYEAKLREQELKEDKLTKDIKYYKRRVIFFKNKININLISRNINNKESNNMLTKNVLKERRNSFNICNNLNNISNRSLKRRSYSKNKNNNLNIASPSPTVNKKSHLCCIRPIHKSTFVNKSDNLKEKLLSSSVNNNSNNESYSNKNMIIVNVEKFRDFMNNKEEGNNSNKKLIKISRNKSKDTNDSNKNEEKIHNNITENLNINDNLNEISPKKNTKEHLITYQKNKSDTINTNYSCSLNLTNDINKKNYFKTHTRDNWYKNSNKKNLKKMAHFQSTKDIKVKKNTEDFINVNSKKYLLNSSNTNRSKKMIETRKIFNLKNEKINLNLKYNSDNKNIENFRYNTYNGKDKNNNNNIKNNLIIESKLIKSNNDVPEIKKTNYKEYILDENNNPIKDKDKEKGKNNIITFGKKFNSNNIRLNNYISNNNKIDNKKKTINNYNYKNSNRNYKNENKPMINVIKKSDKDKEKQLKKLLEDINEDYNNDIEILSSQENQIKLLLNLIDLNEV